MLNINTIFIKICEKLSLSQTLHKKLIEHYRSVSEYLTSCEGLNDLEIYPQGSVAIGTTIKPIGQEEYDLDFVCEKDISPFDLFRIIKENLKNNERYTNIVEEKKRCIRINYNGNFHLDILPARPDQNGLNKTSILIPDKELKNLAPSDPKGYSFWFNQKSDSQTRVDKTVIPLPQYQETIYKSSLQHTVQLIKRHRDIFFKSRPDQSPPSIILTTLCGEYYVNQGNILKSIAYIADNIKNRDVKEVYNPVNPKELLSEKWRENPELYNKFKDWIETLNSDLEILEKEEKLKKETLLRMFGERITQPIFDELEGREGIHSNRKKLSISSAGILSASNNNSIPHNTFYGQEEIKSEKLRTNG